MVIALGLIFTFLALIEAGLLLFCCRIGPKYTGHLFALGLVILLVWILGVIFHATWLFAWINGYLMLIVGVQITLAAIVGEVVNVLLRRWRYWRR
jgi:hypothetical protein